MSEKNSFDQLATEIIFEIFDYLSFDNIIYAFFHLNQQLNSMLFQYYQYSKRVTTPTYYFSLWKPILPMISSHIQCLTITIPNFNFSLDLFPNLKSLIISSSLPIYYDQLTAMLTSEQFKKLTSLKIKSQLANKNDDDKTRAFYKVLINENSLHVFESLLELYESFTDINNLKINLDLLQSLSLNVFPMPTIFSLLPHTPNLKDLKLRVASFHLMSPLDPTIDLSRIKLERFYLVIQYSIIDLGIFLLLTSFIKQFSSSLIYLSLDFTQLKNYGLDLDGFILEQQFLHSMTQLKFFHLYIQLYREPTNVEHFLSTFQTKFWLDHHWTFGMHEGYLYTLPLVHGTLTNFNNFDEIKSSNPEIFNSSQIWSCVRSIDFDRSFKFKSNVIEQLNLKMPNLTSATVDFQQLLNFYRSDDETNPTKMSLGNITTVYFPGHYLQHVKYCLIYIFPNTRRLLLYYRCPSIAPSSNKMKSPQDFEEHFRRKWPRSDSIYSFKIQHIEIKMLCNDTEYVHQHVIHFVKELVEIFNNFQSLIFYFNRMLGAATLAFTPFTDLTKTIHMLTIEKFFKKFKIKHIHNCLYFIRKENV